jgi:hypothetical protein
MPAYKLAALATTAFTLAMSVAPAWAGIQLNGRSLNGTSLNAGVHSGSAAVTGVTLPASAHTFTAK